MQSAGDQHPAVSSQRLDSTLWLCPGMDRYLLLQGLNERGKARHMHAISRLQTSNCRANTHVGVRDLKPAGCKHLRLACSHVTSCDANGTTSVRCRVPAGATHNSMTASLRGSKLCSCHQRCPVCRRPCKAAAFCSAALCCTLCCT